MALNVAAGEGARANGICNIAIGDGAVAIGAYQVVTSEKLTLPTNYTSDMYKQFLAVVLNNLEVYEAISKQNFAPPEFGEKAKKALLPLINIINGRVQELQEQEKRQAELAKEKDEEAPETIVI
jgi:hypothetical protein